jgi:hypothetical protein
MVVLLCPGCLKCIECDPETWRTEIVLHARLDREHHQMTELAVIPVHSAFQNLMRRNAPWSRDLQ